MLAWEGVVHNTSKALVFLVMLILRSVKIRWLMSSERSELFRRACRMGVKCATSEYRLSHEYQFRTENYAGDWINETMTTARLEYLGSLLYCIDYSLKSIVGKKRWYLLRCDYVD